MYKINEYRQNLLNKFKISLNPQSAKDNIFYLSNGQIAYDYLAQYGAVPFGHNPEFLKEAIQNYFSSNQASFIQPNIHPKVEEFATTLIESVNSNLYSRCITTNSGAETVEAALKLARIKTGRRKVLGIFKGFHGKTFAALSASGSNRFKMPYIHDSDSYEYVNLNDTDALINKLSTNEFAAFIVEPVLGEGGMLPATCEFLKLAVELCEKNGTMSIFDEIQTGLGRLGDICAAKKYKIFPDCILFSKALGGGIVPIGAVIYKEQFYDFNFDKKHSSTFANNSLSATVALNVINHLNNTENKIYENVNNLSKYLDERIRNLTDQHSDIINFTGQGLMRAFEFYNKEAQQNILINFCQNNGSLAYIICGFLLKNHNIFVMPLLSQPCSIRFEPPLNINSHDIDRFINALEEICKIIKNGRYDVLFGNLIDIDKDSLPDLSISFPVSYVDDTKIAEINYKTVDKNLNAGKTFAFFIHATSAEDLVNTFPYSIKQNFNDNQLRQLADEILDIARIDYSPDVGAFFSVYNDKTYANGMFIFSPLSPKDMMRLNEKEKLDLMLEYLQVAEENGAELVGLGAYTSVIANGGTSILPHANNLTVTNGNSLTALSTVESLFSLIEDKNVEDACAVIVGARGSVGKIAVSGVAHKYGNLILLGRPGSELKIQQDIIPYLIQSCLTTDYQISKNSFFDKLSSYLSTTDYKKINFDKLVDDFLELGLSLEVDYQIAFSKADAVISATSEGKGFLNTKYLKKSALVFDAARPFDFVNDDDFKIYEGGLVRQPNEVFYSDCNMVKAPAGINLACLSETIALALDNTEEHQSIGKSIDFKKASNILNIAKKQGFKSVNYNVE